MHNGAILYVNSKTVFFDYSDDVLFLEDHSKYDFYFKRSLSIDAKIYNVYPLNFNVPISYKTTSLLLSLNRDFLFYKHNKTELYRALDFLHLKSNSAHSLLDVRKLNRSVSKGNGEPLYYTRLWNPNSTNDPQEKERRFIQNEFRINACRIIKNTFKNAKTGLFPDPYSIKRTSDIVLDLNSCKKSNYLKTLKQFSIGVADDGLKDTPGWKIGEYLLYGKAVISTPIKVQIDQFKIGENYLSLSDRTAYKELPDKIRDLQRDERYMEMAQENLKWSKQYLHPQNYLNRVLEIIDNSKK
ncbi:hypothetical protein DDD_2300 [Nonlabens dokdonensis DSW-6]|jgi:hypothetical protein|uniref:Glycosyltransferase n=2 Tax=Nonlabens dokdonensis TaxID=328515 RepID=L7WB49_NONDD|nr:hypothetical protein DDD_2300 [Nonlabens dokdonensis DSW-6]